MAKDRLSGKLAVILHADIAESTMLVQQDERLGHERIQDAFRHFSETIAIYIRVVFGNCVAMRSWLILNAPRMR